MSPQPDASTAYAAAFGTPEGRAVLADLMRASGVLAVSHTPGDSHETAYAEGRRSVGLHIINMMKWNEAELLHLARERRREMLVDTEAPA